MSDGEKPKQWPLQRAVLHGFLCFVWCYLCMRIKNGAGITMYFATQTKASRSKRPELGCLNRWRTVCTEKRPPFF